MPKVKAKNLAMNYEQQGTGEPLILIPYLAADHACYAFQVAEYAKHFTCISLDLRGTGETDKPEGAYSMRRSRSSIRRPWGSCSATHEPARQRSPDPSERFPEGTVSNSTGLFAYFVRAWNMTFTRLQSISRATALLILFASAANAQVPTGTAGLDATPFRVQIWGDLETDFDSLISSYYKLRGRLEKGVPDLTVTDDPAEIAAVQLALATKIRAARASATEGEIFTSAISVTFKKLLILEVDEGTMAAIMDDNPGEFAHPINGTYPSEKPFATMPVNLLAALPRLPADLEYRFTGHQLVLIDTRANVILDRIPCAIECSRQ